MLNIRSCLAVLALLCGLVAPGRAADIALGLSAGSSGNHRYYHRLLQEALKDAGHTVTITSYENLPQTRIFAYLETDRLSLHWMLRTPERDAQFARIDVPLTQGLIGQRILFVAKGNEGLYANVKDLAQFRALGKVAGLGKGWFDAVVWDENKLPYIEQPGEWRQLFSMLAARDRGIDYFPRGATEIMGEAALHPELAIEPNLLLVYQRDFVFYLSRGNAHLKPLIEGALKQAEKSGLQKRLLDEYFGGALNQLNLDKRVKIRLVTP